MAFLSALSNAGESERPKEQEETPAGAEEPAPEVPPDVDYQLLQNLNPVELNKILDDNKETSTAGALRTQLLSKKKLYGDTMFQNSDEFKALGNLHKDNRVIDYYPQDDKGNFSTRPKILGGKYDFAEGGLSLQHRVPDNLVGESLKAVRENTDTFNKYLAQDMTSYTTVSSGFPLTTNQDFHSDEVFQKAARL